MGKLRKIALAALVSCFAVCSGLAIAACTDKNAPPFRKPAGFVEQDEKFDGRYTVTVRSAGGMSLNGVRIDFVKGNETAASGISKNGIISLRLEPDVYRLAVDAKSLPDGYYLDGEQTYTKVDDGSVDIKIPSRVIQSAATSGASYSVGDVMYDFAYTDAVGGAKHTLSELLGGANAYKAVMLNFFFIDCGPCRLEFPAIEEAYQAYKDKIAVVALSVKDSAAKIAEFAEQTGLNFHMGYDSAGMTAKFNVGNFPTTVIVDRYGVVAQIDNEGSKSAASYWRGLFQHYTSDAYEQKNDDNETPKPTEFTRPPQGLTMPSSAEIDAALTGEVKGGASVNGYYAEEGADKEFSWPFLIKGESAAAYLDAANAEADYSFSTLYAEITLTAGDAISYEYCVVTESEHDFLYALVDGKIVGAHSGKSDGWQTASAVYVANRNETVTLAFMYYKDLKESVDNERASIRNLNIRPVSEVASTVDQSIFVLNGVTYDKSYQNALTGGYNISISKGGDGYYYLTRDGKTALLLADILNGSYWSEKHLGKNTFTDPEGSAQAASVYLLSFWTMSNYNRADKEIPLKFNYLTAEQSEKLIESYYLQGFSDNGLLPVTDALIDILNAFIDGMHRENAALLADGDEKYAGQWLEFCYYFKHFGAQHDPGDKDKYHECYETLDPVKGLIYDNALTAYEGTAKEPYANAVKVNKMLNLGDGGGVKFKFVPEHTGVYLFYSDAPTAIGVDPKLFVFDSAFNLLLEADNDLRNTAKIYSDRHDEYYAFVWLEAGETYYVHGAMSVPGDTGTYNMFIEYQSAETVNYLRVASTGDGLFTFNEDPFYYYYLAINVAKNPSDGLYYEYTDDFDFGSPVYIDFVHQNYFDENGHSIYEMIENGIFDFRENGGMDYTVKMQSYYQKATVGKDKDDELYGLIQANDELVSILSFACQIYYEEGAASGAWEMFACYYEYIGNPANK